MDGLAETKTPGYSHTQRAWLCLILYGFSLYSIVLGLGWLHWRLGWPSGSRTRGLRKGDVCDQQLTPLARISHHASGLLSLAWLGWLAGCRASF